MKNSTVMYNSAAGGAGIALQYPPRSISLFLPFSHILPPFLSYFYDYHMYQAHYTLSGMTIANNSATNSLGGGIYINAGTSE